MILQGHCELYREAVVKKGSRSLFFVSHHNKISGNRRVLSSAVFTEDEGVIKRCNSGGRIYWCWQQGDIACFCVTYFSKGCAWGCLMYTIVAKQHQVICEDRFRVWLPESRGLLRNVNLHIVINRETLVSWKLPTEPNRVFLFEEHYTAIDSDHRHLFCTHVRWLSSESFLEVCEPMQRFLLKKTSHWQSFSYTDQALKFAYLWHF